MIYILHLHFLKTFLWYLLAKAVNFPIYQMYRNSQNHLLFYISLKIHAIATDWSYLMLEGLSWESVI